jgi:hypothetical protein
MSLPHWLLRGAAMLGAALLPGCVSSPVDPTLNPHDHVPDLPYLRGRGPESPYHQQPDTGSVPPTAVQRVNHHDEPPPLKADPAPTDPLPPVKPVVIPISSPQPEPPQESRKPAPPDEPLVVAVKAYLQKRPADALQAISRYDKANQEMLLVVLPLAARLTEGSIDKASPRETAELADLLQGVEDRLRQRAALRIEKMLFVRRIDDFGVYVARELVNGIATFEGGAGDQVGEEVQVYLELRNVSSKQRGDTYETRLAGTVELLDFEQRSAYRWNFWPEPHVSRSPRHDFFVKCAFSVPRKVPAGRYTMRVEIRDVTGLAPDSLALKAGPPSHRVAEQTLDLQVTPPRLAAR